jgi:hypothetical protein
VRGSSQFRYCCEFRVFPISGSRRCEDLPHPTHSFSPLPLFHACWFHRFRVWPWRGMKTHVPHHPDGLQRPHLANSSVETSATPSSAWPCSIWAHGSGYSWSLSHLYPHIGGGRRETPVLATQCGVDVLTLTKRPSLTRCCFRFLCLFPLPPHHQKCDSITSTVKHTSTKELLLFRLV